MVTQLSLPAISRPHRDPKPGGLDEPVIKLYFDGGCSPNPGGKYGSFEVVFQSRSVLLQRLHLGYGTNNEAEFETLEAALIALLGFLDGNDLAAGDYAIEIFTDSTIVRDRMMGKNIIFRKM